MGAPHCVMKHYDPMIGCDFHFVVLPPDFVPKGPAPYFTMSLLNGLLVFFTPLPKQVTLYGVTVAKGSDIGGGIPHIGAPSADLAITILTSGSKCHFGADSYKVENKPPALALLVDVNPNLNCGTPVPTITGAVIALNTHAAGMSWADVLGGFASLAADAIMQTIFNALGTAFGNMKFFQGTGLLATKIWTGITFFLGTPLGPGLGNTNIFKDKDGNGWSPGGAVESFVNSGAENVGRAVGDILDGQPPHWPEIPEFAGPKSGNLPKPSNLPLIGIGKPE